MTRATSHQRPALACVLGFLFLGAGFFACAVDKPSVPGPPYRAQVLTLEPATDAAEPPRYTLTDKSFAYLSDLANLDGKYFKIIFGGQLKIEDIIGSLATNPRFTGGSKPLLRYSVEGGALVPRDYTTLALLSAYYQYEQVYAGLEAMTGLSADGYLGESGKVQILFEPSITRDDGGVKAEFIQKLNASYIPGQKQFVLFRRSAIERVPIAMNYQVIAHEFGHALYEYAFYSNRFDSCDGAQRQRIISGLNEGFADVVSWAATGSADILSNSIPLKATADARNFARVGFDYDNLKSASLIPTGDEICDGSIYCFGTLFAAGVLRAHQSLGRSNDQDSRYGTMRVVFAALRATRAAIDAATSNSALRAQRLLTTKSCEDIEEGPVDADDDALVSAYLGGFTASAPAEWKGPLCAAFGDLFGADGFASDARAGVCP